jgi:hypothetical protein
MNSGNVFWLRAIAVFAIVLGVLGTSLTELRYIEFPFRILLVSAGLLSLFRKRVGIVLLAIALALSIPDVEIGSFYWTPVRLIRFPLGGSLSSSSASYRFGIDIVSIILLSALMSFFNIRRGKPD